MKEKKNQLLQASTILFILNISASALNYLCQLVMARVLSVESYGTVNTIFSFMMIIAVPGTTLTMIVAKKLAGELVDSESKKRGYVKNQIYVVFSLTVFVFLCLLIMKNSLKHILIISDEFVIMITFGLAALGFFQPLYSGILSGTKHFVWVGIYSLLIPLYKLTAIGIAYIIDSSDQFRLYTVLIVILLGTILTACIGQYKSTKIVGKIKKTDVYGQRPYSIIDLQTLILNLSLMFYMNIDLLTVRYFADERESGLYSAVLLFGRIIYYFATTLGTILLPQVASKDISRKEQMSTFHKALGMMILFAFICMVPINIYKNFFITILYGKDYIEAAKYVIFVSLISLALSIYTIIVNFSVGIGKTKITTIIMLIIDVLLILNIYLCSDLSNVLCNIGLIGLLGTIIIYIYLFKSKKND